MSRSLFSILFFLMMVSKTVIAADFVAVRVGDHGDRVRVVFEWPNGDLPAHHVKRIDDQTTEITFAAPMDIQKMSMDESVPEIVDVRRVSDPGKPLRVWVMQSGPHFKRDVRAGRRVILDFAVDQKLRAQEKQLNDDGVVDQKVLDQKAGDQKEISKEDADVKAVGGIPGVVLEKSLTVPPVEDGMITEPPLAVDSVAPPIVTLASLNKMGVAGFIKNQTLWIVVDTPDFQGAPQLSGKGVEKFGPVKKFETKEATVFKWALPARTPHVRGDGGDLHWRVIFTAADKKIVPPADLQRIDAGKSRGVLWPIVVTKLIPLRDPDTGEDMVVGTVSVSTKYAGEARAFSEFYIPQSIMGIAVVQKVDDLKVTHATDGVMISRPDGVSMTSSLQAETYIPQTVDGAGGLPPPPTGAQSEQNVKATLHAEPNTSEIQKIVDATGTAKNILYRFDRWAMGGASSLTSNEMALLTDLSEKKPEERGSGLMNIGKMYLSSGRGAEAVAYFRLALESAPSLIDNPEFVGLRGAAYALNGQYDLAIDDLNNPNLSAYVDIPFWRAVVIGKLQDWSKVPSVQNVDVLVAEQYPWAFGPDMILTMVESILRGGKPVEAQRILSKFQTVLGQKAQQKNDNSLHLMAVLSYADYLNGELARQQGKKEIAAEIWEKLEKSKDDKFRARAKLALTVMNFDNGKITAAEAINQLESMRFNWRGDDFEMAIGARLGETYLAGGDYVRGFSMLRDTVSLAPESESGRRIATLMTEKFRMVFTPEHIKKIDPIDAITVFEKFGELAPVGTDSNNMMMNLVDRLLEVDLLDRATRILQDLVDHKLVDAQRVDGALRLAAVHLMNDRPDLTLGVLNRAQAMMDVLPKETGIENRGIDLGLLRARALSKSERVDQALTVLGGLPQDNPNVLRLAADIAWQTGRWGDVSAALSKLIALDPVLLSKPPTDTQAEIIQNLAVAVNLGGDRTELARVRALYSQAMSQTNRADAFDVVTRERQVPTLADRDTLNKLVEEVDLFEKFLGSFRKSVPASGTGGAPTPAPAPAPPATTTPVPTSAAEPVSGE